MSKRWIPWLSILLAIEAMSLGPGVLLAAQGAVLVGRIVMIAGQLLALGWLAYGMWSWRRLAWVQKAGSAGVSALVIGLLLLTVGQHWMVVALAGTWAMGVAFVAGIWVIRQLLLPGRPVLGVARTVVDEAIRMKIALIFIIGVLLLVCFLPFALNPAERLQYRMQFFLTWGLAGTSFLLSIMTIFLACGTICSEIKHRQIFMTLTKPVGRGEYLLGKWLGVVLLNALLLSVSVIGVYAFTKLLHQPQFAQGADDWQAVNAQVLVARQAITPKPARGVNLAQQFEQQVQRLQREDAETYGPQLTPQQVESIRNTILARWHTVGPRNSQTYVFDGLGRAQDLADSVQMRFKPVSSQTPPDDMVNLALWINDRPWPYYNGAHLPIRVANDNFHVIDLPTSLIDSAGQLSIRIANVNLLSPEQTHPASISFSPNGGLEVLYRVDTFEANLLRGAAMIWLRLAFLATLGLAAGTFLGFPVASLLAMMVFFGASASDFLSESLRFYAGFTDEGTPLWDTMGWFFGQFGSSLAQGNVWEAIKLMIRVVGEGFILLVPSFSRYNPVPLISKGRVVDFSLLGSAVLWIGLIWSGALGLLAWGIFRRRELARVIV